MMKKLARKKIIRIILERVRSKSHYVGTPGYRLIWHRDLRVLHPNGKKEHLLHRIILEVKLNRFLERGEQSHHLNNNRLDNRPSNLVMISASDHKKLHPIETIRKVCIVQRCGNKHRLHDYCNKHYKRWWKTGDPLKVKNDCSAEELERWESIRMRYKLGTRRFTKKGTV